MAVEISVITCAHNPRSDYLDQVLKALRHQTLTTDRWEYLLIDNCSDQPLAPRIDLSWHPNARQIREGNLGLTHARLRGIRESAAELIIFVDDDNVLDENYLEQGLTIAEERPQLGSWSGQTRPGFDETPPEWTKRYWGNLVIRSLDADQWSNLPHLPETMPLGAGLCVRREVASHYTFLHSSGRRSFVLDRVGDSLLSAGDNDLAACACDIGLGVGVFRSLKLTHLIPATRLREDYLLKLAEGIAYSGVVFRSFRSQIPEETFRRRVADSLRLMTLRGRERRFFRAWLRGESRATKDLKASEPSQRIEEPEGSLAQGKSLAQ